MEIRELAERILTADTLEEKLLDFSRESITDHSPGPPLFISEPTRPPGMGFQQHRGKSDKLPPFHEHGNADKRAVCLHRFAGHELLAVELMAYALLAFPEAPKNFRKGLLHTLQEEQEHVRLYSTHMQRLGIRLGDLPFYRHFWAFAEKITSPLKYVSTLSLTFEMANLDFAPMYSRSFRRHRDEESAGLMDRILQDEIAHVRFGWQWLKKFKSPEEGTWEAWETALPEPLSPKRAKGFMVHDLPRQKAGIPQEWIDRLQEY